MTSQSQTTSVSDCSSVVKSATPDSFALCFEEPMCFGLVVSSNASSQWSIIQPLRPAADANDNSFALCNDGHFRTVRKERLHPVVVGFQQLAS